MPLRDLGVGFATLQSSYTRPAPQSALAREAATEVRVAEQCGFDSYWVSEHHHSYDGYNPSPLTLASFLTASTSSIRLGTGILIAGLHRPAEVASAVATIHALDPARTLRLGVGLGYREPEFAAAGHPVSARRYLFERHVDELMNGEASEAVREVEWWFGGVTPTALARAGRYGVGALLMFVTPKRIERCRELYMDAFRPGAASEPRIGLIKEVWVDRDSGRRDEVRARLREMWRQYASTTFADLTDPEQRAGAEALSEDWQSTVLVGTPAQVADELSEFVQSGVDTLALRVRFDGTPVELVAECLELIAAEVAPQLRAIS